MEVRRIVPIKLDVAGSDADLLHETISEFLWAANYVIDHAWQGEYKTTSKAELQRETYDDVRAETRFQANIVQNARYKAAAVQSVVVRWKQGDYAGKPHFTASALVYDKRCATFNDDHASLSTVAGRLTAEYVLSDEGRETPHSEYLFNDDYEVTGGKLHYRDGEFYLHVRTKTDVESELAADGGQNGSPRENFICRTNSQSSEDTSRDNSLEYDPRVRERGTYHIGLGAVELADARRSTLQD